MKKQKYISKSGKNNLQKKKKIYLITGTISGPPSRFRLHQFKPFFESLQYEVRICVSFPDRKTNFPYRWRALKYLPTKLKQVLRLASTWWSLRSLTREDIVISNRDIVPELNVTYFEKAIKKKGATLIFDFDDAIFLGARRKKLDEIFPLADFIVAGNKYLLNYAISVNPNSSIIPTVVNTNYFTPKKINSQNKKIVVGWSGSASTRIKHLPLLKKIIEDLAKIFEFTFLVIADQNPELSWDHPDIQFEKWSEENEVQLLKRIDIGLMPLTNDNHDQGKCGFKAIQYMAVGTPAVVSPVGVNKQIITHDVDGFHAKEHSDWLEYIETLVNDEKKRVEMGIAARKKIEKEYSLIHASALWKKILQ